MREVMWGSDAMADHAYWKKTDSRICERIDRLIESARLTPEHGLGKPKSLRGELSGWWSRRITQEQRLVYRHDRDAIYVLQCRYHYG